jgi:hypothetical protein
MSSLANLWMCDVGGYATVNLEARHCYLQYFTQFILSFDTVPSSLGNIKWTHSHLIRYRKNTKTEFRRKSLGQCHELPAPGHYRKRSVTHSGMGEPFAQGPLPKRSARGLGTYLGFLPHVIASQPRHLILFADHTTAPSALSHLFSYKVCMSLVH